MTVSRSSFVAALVGICVGLAPIVEAQTVAYNSFGSGYTYDPSGYLFGAPGGPTPVSSQGLQFVAQAGGTLTGIDFAAYYWPGYADAVNVFLYSDANGQLGTVLGAASSSGGLQVFEGGETSGSVVHLSGSSFGLPTLTKGDAYWLYMTPATSDSDIVWMYDPIPLVVNTVYSQAPSGTLLYVPQSQAAFDILVTPEPSTLIVFGVSGVCLMTRRRRIK
jgi:hypothetical protein